MTQDWVFLGKKRPDFLRIPLVCLDGTLGSDYFLLLLVLCPQCLETSCFKEI